MSTEATSIDDAAKPGSTTTDVNWTSIVLYIVLAFGISWTIWLSLRAVGVPFGTRVIIGVFGPALAAVLVRLIRREGFADAGSKFVGRGPTGIWCIYIAAYLVPPLIIAASIVLVLLLGVQHWALSDNLHQLAIVMTNTLAKQGQHLPAGSTAEQLVENNITTQVVEAFTLGIPFNMLFTFGEEFGWRGYLLPRLAPMGGILAAVITGVIWGLWHAPLIVLDGYNYPGHPWLGVAMMVLFTVALSMIFAWLRFRSGSVWPSTLAHAAFNAQAGFAILLLSRADSLLSAPVGLVGLIPMFAFAIWLAVTGRLKALPDQLPEPTHV